MDLLNGAGVSGGKQNGTNPKTLNVIAPDHPFWNQSVLPTQKMSMLEHQFFSPSIPQQLNNGWISPTEDLGLSNLKLVGQSFQNNGLENSIPLDDAPTPYMQSISSNHSNNLRLAPIGSSSAYQVSEAMPNLFDFRDDLNNQNQVSQQNTSITSNQRQAIASESLSKANDLTMKQNIRQDSTQIWPERNQTSKQKSNYIEHHNGIGPRFKNHAISKSNGSYSSNIPSSSTNYKANHQPPRLMNKKMAQTNPKTGIQTNGKTHPRSPVKKDELSISLSSTSDEEEEEESLRDDTGVWLYVAKSNIWVDSEIENKNLKHSKGSTDTDETKLRLDLGKLTEIVRKGRQVIDLQCYGPEPPDIDTIWKLAKKKGWDSVSPKNNQTLRYETQNQFDAPISTDIMELVGCSHLKNLKFEKCKNVVVLIASETGEYLSKIIGKIMNQEGWWKIEIWSRKGHISNNVREFATEYPEIVEINYLDEEKLKEKFKFTHFKLDFKGKVDKIEKRWLYNYGILFEDVNLEIGSYVGEAFQKIIKDLNWPFKYIWMNDEKNKSEVHLNLLILFERPNGSKAKEKSEFLGEYLPKLRSSLLNDLCRRIVSYHEYDKEKDDDDDDIAFTNRYSFLTDVQDDEEDLESQEMSDEAVNAPFDLYEELEKQQEETTNQIKETEWEQVIHKPRGGPSPAQIYPTRCIYGFICTYGTKCHYEHTKEEKEVFQARTAAKKIGKVPFHDNKYRTELCNFNIPHDRAACPFAHGMTQMICKICYKVGHDVDTCTAKKVVTTPSDDGKLTW